MLDMFLVPAKTVVTAKGDGAAVELSFAGNRALLLSLVISNVIEQESLDVSLYGSADGTTWTEKPLLAFPQQFYRGEYPLLLDLGGKPEIKFLRAHWDVNRWGRGSEAAMFEFALRAREVPAEMLARA